MDAHVIEVVVRGPLGRALIAALDGYHVETADDGLTTIVGSVADQSQLLGMLEMFDGLHIEVVSVNRVVQQ